MNRHRDVAEKGLGARGGQLNKPAPVGERITEMVKEAVDFFVFHLVVTDGRLRVRVPVHEVAALIDETATVQGDKHVAHRVVETLVHREPLTLPVEAGADFLELLADNGVVVFLDLPGAFDEGVTAQVVAGFAFFAQLVFDHLLGGNTRVVGPRYPEGRPPLHAPVPHQRVLKRIIETVAHMENTRDVGRGNGDNERFPLAARRKEVVFHPEIVEAIFKISRIIGLRQFNLAHGARL